MRELLLKLVNQHKSFEEIIPVVRQVFSAIEERDEWVNEFFMHPLGFYYCRLLISEQHQIRLHIWERGYPKKDDLFIHDHYYDLCSWVLCGKILDYSYSVETAENVSEYALFISSYLKDKNVRTVTKTDQFMNVEKTGERIIEKSQRYIIPRGSYHSNFILFEESEITVTFVFTYNHKENNSPNVIGLVSNEIYYESDPLNVPADKVRSLITTAKQCIFQ